MDFSSLYIAIPHEHRQTGNYPHRNTFYTITHVTRLPSNTNIGCKTPRIASTIWITAIIIRSTKWRIWEHGWWSETMGMWRLRVPSLTNTTIFGLTPGTNVIDRVARYIAIIGWNVNSYNDKGRAVFINVKHFKMEKALNVFLLLNAVLFSQLNIDGLLLWRFRCVPNIEN